MSRWLLYIDDSGTKEYAASPADYSTRGNSRYFVFGGLLLEESAAGSLGDAIADLKRHTFGSAEVEIKSNWLRIPKEREVRYLARFGLVVEQLDAFVEELYRRIVASPVQLMAAVIDKVHVGEDYERPWYAPAIAYELILQRVVQEVRAPSTVAVAIDDMSGATPKGNQYKANLKNQHHLLRTKGSSLQKGINFAPLEAGIRFLNSARSHLIQVADIVSYNVYRQFVDHGDAWEDEIRKVLPAYNWFARLEPKFRTDGAGRIQGFGIVKFPLRKRILWGTYKEKTAP